MLVVGELEDAGYPFVDTTVWILDDDWQKIHEWCSQEIGHDLYTCIGSRFWFLDTDDAARFALVWT
jgi:hypothetical protein